MLETLEVTKPLLWDIYNNGVGVKEIVLVDAETRAALSITDQEAFILSPENDVDFLGGMKGEGNQFTWCFRVDWEHSRDMTCGIDIAELQVHPDSPLRHKLQESNDAKFELAITADKVRNVKTHYC